MTFLELIKLIVLPFTAAFFAQSIMLMIYRGAMHVYTELKKDENFLYQAVSSISFILNGEMINRNDCKRIFKYSLLFTLAVLVAISASLAIKWMIKI